ncbi:MAG: CpXC domain-containing protein [Chloroflexota bacterium]
MSGILIPGQENRPRPSGGIELPKGFSSSREREQEQENVVQADEKEEQPVESVEDNQTFTDSGIALPSGSTSDSAGTSTPIEMPDDETTPDTPEAGQSQGQPQEELLFPPMGAQIQCPSCGTPYTVPVFSIIDLGVNPELKMPLLSGQVNIALCRQCGAGGPMGAPLMVHDPENDFLGVYVPAESGMNDIQRQKAIGDLTQTLMNKLPTESRRGYMLQPQPFMDWQRFMEKLWESEGVTPEMLRRQGAQSSLLQQLLGLANDEKALELAIERNRELIDRQFIAILQQYLTAAEAQGRVRELELMMALYEKVLAVTDAGAEVQQLQDKVRGILEQITNQTTRPELLTLLVDAWKDEDGDSIIPALMSSIYPMLDYQFLVALSERVDAAESDEDKEILNELREFVVTFQDQQRQQQEAVVQQVQTIVQDVMQADNPQQQLRQYADYINDAFMNILVANIQQAQQQNQMGVARTLSQIYQMALEIVQERMPPEMRLLNQLMAAPDEASVRQLLRENRHMLTNEFMAALEPMEAQMREGGRADLADRLKSIRGRVALMR